MKKLITLSFLPTSPDLGLLLLRIAVGVCLFVKHGLFKIPLMMQAAPQFPDPFGLGTRVTVAIAFLSDGIAAILFVLGFGTRLAALVMIANLAVAWGAVYGFKIAPANGELLILFLGGTIAVFLAGPGRFSIDAQSGNKPRRRGK